MTSKHLSNLARISYDRAIALGEAPGTALRIAITDARVVGQDELEAELARIRFEIGRYLEVVT